MKKLGLLLIMLCGVSLFVGCPEEKTKTTTTGKTTTTEKKTTDKAETKDVKTPDPVKDVK